ncbi:MAG: WD40-repeat-containing domain protein [Monoraphidium minutum]|nr:MAG: WD40-repeat-containing domain protein [Monoraphidium minutum]
MVNDRPEADEDEAFVGDEGGLPEGVEVLDDLEGMQEDSSDGALDEEEDGPSGAPAQLEDDSIQLFEGHTDAVLAVAWNPVQPDMVATGGQDDRAFLWRVGQDALEQTGGTLGTLELSGHTDTVVSLAFSSSGALLASGGLDGAVRVWDAADGACLRVLEGPADDVHWVAWHPRGDVVLAGSEDFSAWMWLARSGDCMQVFSGHRGPVTAGAFSADGKAVVTAGGEGDASLRVWNPKTGECTLAVSGHPFHEEGVTCLALTGAGDAGAALTGAADGGLRVTNTHNGRVLAALAGHEDSVEAVGFSRHLPLAASAGMDGKLVIWDANGWTQRGVCEHPQGVTRMAWHPTQPIVATACLDGAARWWDLRTGACVRVCGGHTDGIQDIALSPDGSMALTGADDGTARVFTLTAN